MLEKRYLLLLLSNITTLKLKVCATQIVQEVRYIRNSEERQQIMRACHVEPTSGHMGIKRTVHGVTECFFWKGVTKDVECMVRNFCSYTCLLVPLRFLLMGKCESKRM